MAPGERPSLPEDGSAAEMARVYLETVGHYRRCEDQKADMARAIRGAK